MAIFQPDISLNNSSTLWLEQVVRQYHTSKSIFMSVQGLSKAASTRLCGVFIEEKLASFAWYMPRTCSIRGKDCTGISVGLVTTLAEYRRQGLASLLFESLEDFARTINVDFLYLAGIPNFYDRLGFKGFAPKSKFLFSTSKIPSAVGRIVPFDSSHLAIVTSYFDQCRIASNGLSKRSEDAWKDLLGPLSTTFLFYKPRLILNHNDHVVAYFCTSPDNPTLIREFIPSLEPGSVETALGVIAQSPDFSGVDTIEIFAPFQGPVLCEAFQNLEADFTCFLRPRSSNMLKWLSGPSTCYNNSKVFIYQGDNL